MTDTDPESQRHFSIEDIVNFSRFLRENGIRTSPPESAMAAEALSHIRSAGGVAVFHSLKTVLCHTEEEWKSFDMLFQLFWSRGSLRREITKDRMVQAKGNPEGQTATEGFSGHSRKLYAGSTLRYNEKGELSVVSLYSPEEMFGSYSRVDVFEGAEARRLLAALKRISRLMPTSPSRRFADSQHGTINFRRYIRSVAQSEEPGSLPLRGLKLAKSSFIVIADMSGSMEGDWKFPLVLSHIAVNHFPGSHAYCFSTSHYNLTTMLQGRPVRAAFSIIPKLFPAIGGGTRIANSIEEILKHPMKKNLGDYVVIIYSDGFDFDDTERLRTCLIKLSRMVRMVVWINPRADHPDFAPGRTPMATFMDVLGLFSSRHEFLSLGLKRSVKPNLKV
ncbi:MAG TPA: VWA domain-containing protein [Thermoplasmataceae archaeon]|nr:VWA domain-containing protein [Thermoplasmataceae archaeon]